MKSKILFIATILFFTIMVKPAFATEQESDTAAKLSEAESSKIASSCGTIRQNLKNLQRSDARTRTFFGSIYETIASKYLKPLNLRLINNDLSSTDLSKLQSSLATARSAFSDDYIAYSKSLEELIATDCRLEPEAFYNKLLSTRKKRATVAKDVKTLNDLIVNAETSVEKLKGTLAK